jgi:uncharacterized membrane protein YvbJ
MIDPTSDVGEVDADDAPECVQCGTPITGHSHRVRTRIVDGDAEHTHFCSDGCLREWEDG